MKIRQLAAVVLAVVMCFSATACGARQSKYGSAFRFPLCAEPVQLDPQMAQDAASVEVLTATMEGLTRLTNEGEVVPAVAETWEISPDGKTVTFSLRHTTWSDGTPLTAEDFAFAFARAVDPATRSPLKEKFKNFASAKAVDESTFVLTLKQADSELLRKLSKTAYYPCPAAFFEKSAGHYGMEQEYVLCNGAFTLSSWSHGEYLILRKNSKYYAAEEILPDAVRYVVNADEAEAVQLLESEALSAAAVPESQLSAVKRAGFATKTVFDGLYALWFNTKSEGLSTAVRLALCNTVDRQKLTELLEKDGEHIAVGFVPPDTLCGGERYVRESDGFGSFDEGKKRISGLSQLTLLCGEDARSVEMATEILQTWQKRFSLYFKLEKLPAEELSARISSGDYELALGTAVATGGTVQDVLTAFSTGDVNNVTGLADRTFDELLKKAVAEDARDAYKKAEIQLYKSCPCLPLYYPARTFAFGKGVEGVNVRPFGGGVYGAVYDFRKATK